MIFFHFYFYLRFRYCIFLGMRDFVHPVDMPKICDRLHMSMQDMAKVVGMSSEKGLYKWRVPKEFGEKSNKAARPDFETCLKLIRMGATLEEIFGITETPIPSTVVENPELAELRKRIDALERDRLDRSKVMSGYGKAS